MLIALSTVGLGIKQYRDQTGGGVITFRRGLVIGGTGLVLASMWGVGGLAGAGRDPSLIRPPGALDEERFLAKVKDCVDRYGHCVVVASEGTQNAEGKFLAIETKAPGKRGNTTTMQHREIAGIHQAGGAAIVIDDVAQLNVLDSALRRVPAAGEPRPS